MPDLTVRIREDGSVSVAKIPLSWIPGMDQVSLDPDIVARFTDANVQHIHLDYHDAGMAVLANGMLILDFRYDDYDELRTLLTALTLFMGDEGQTLSNLAKTLLPVLEFIGAEVTFEFPVPSHRSVIPKADGDSLEILDSSDIADGDARAQVRGIETISLSTTALGKVTSDSFIFKVLRAALPPDIEVELPPTTVAGIREKGITEITVKNRRYGLAIELNGQSTAAADLQPGQSAGIRGAAGSLAAIGAFCVGATVRSGAPHGARCPANPQCRHQAPLSRTDPSRRLAMRPDCPSQNHPADGYPGASTGPRSDCAAAVPGASDRVGRHATAQLRKAATDSAGRQAEAARHRTGRGRLVDSVADPVARRGRGHLRDRCHRLLAEK